jgi:hypothetical protein
MPRNYNSEASTHTAGLTADSLVKSGKGIYTGYTVTTAVAVAAIVIRDSLTAGAGDIIDVIPIGAAAGSTKQRNVIFKRGLFVDFGATTTGTIIAEYM